MIRRREFITLLGGATAAWPLAARAQQGTLPVIGFVYGGVAEASFESAFRRGLGETGYVEGQSVAVEYHWLAGQYEQVPSVAADLVRRQVQVIVTQGTPAALAAKGATSTVPIVFELGTDPVQAGVVASFNRPGGNITGVTNIAATLAAKQLELFHQLVPHSDTIGILTDPVADRSTQTLDLQDAARALGLKVVMLRAHDDQELDAAFATIVRQRSAALLLTNQTFFNSRR